MSIVFKFLISIFFIISLSFPIQQASAQSNNQSDVEGKIANSFNTYSRFFSIFLEQNMYFRKVKVGGISPLITFTMDGHCVIGLNSGDDAYTGWRLFGSIDPDKDIIDFSVLHEIGHCYQSSIKFKDRAKYTVDELELHADIFALCYLRLSLPKERSEKLIKRIIIIKSKSFSFSKSFTTGPRISSVQAALLSISPGPSTPFRIYSETDRLFRAALIAQ